MTTVTLTAASSSPWTAPAGVTSVQVQCWGPGGDGANGLTNNHSGAGGGGGEYAADTVTTVPGNTYVFTVGAGGSGTATTFTASVAVTAHAGASAVGTTGASGGSGSANGTHANGGNGGNGSAGTGNRGGGGGGGAAGTSGVGGTGGVGGPTSGGSGGTAGTGGGTGGDGGNPTGAASAGNTPGGGGGGGSSTASIGRAGASGADGQIVLTYTASTVHSGTATLTGSGTLSGTGAFAGAANLTGSGTLTWSGSRIYKATVLSGSGTLSGSRIGIIGVSAALSGSGTLTAARAVTRPRAAALSGSGSLAVPGFTLGLSLTLTGTGSLTVIGTGGTVQASAGPSSPYARPGTSQVAVAPPGSTAWRYLGELGLVTALTYSFVCPGGADKLDCTVMLPAAFRDQIQTPGWQVRVTRGGHIVWTGRMDEPVPSPSGWQFTAVGDGQRGQDFRAYFTSTWPSGEPDQAINNAISRGLPWVNPGIGTPSGIWLGQAQDPGSSTITDLLNLVCTRGALTWYANSQPGGQPGTDISVFPLPTTVNRLLVVTDPVARTLGGDVNTIFIRYQITDASSDETGGSQQATYGTTTVSNAASVAAHGVTETYVDLSSAGVMSAGAAQAVGNKVLQAYTRASFAGPFTAAYGQLLNAGGAPVDPGSDQAGTVCRLILTDFAYGGEVNPTPVTLLIGSYTWDDFAGKATLVPYQSLDQSLSGLLSMESTVLAPITVQP